MAIRPSLNFDATGPRRWPRDGEQHAPLSVHVPRQLSKVDRTAGEESARWTQLAEDDPSRERKRVVADVLLWDGVGRMLLVDPTYQERWELPGGIAGRDESPRCAAERLLRDEFGLTIALGRLLLVDWVGPRGHHGDEVIFVFDAGVLSASQAAALRTIDEELGGFEFVAPAEATHRLPGDPADRLARAIRAKHEGGTAYTERRRG